MSNRHLAPFVFVAFLAACGGKPDAGTPETTASSGAGNAAPIACADLARQAVPNATIAMAEPVAAGAFQLAPSAVPPMGPPADYSKLPAFCRIAGTLSPVPDSTIGFELWLPAAGWNGKILQVGNGGAAGSIVYSALAEGLQRGYAVSNTDTGHVGGGGDFSWAAGQPERLKDYAWRSVHETATAGRALTTLHYGKEPARSYWNGCSTGGRQGLMAAQRFPDDFDAIVAGAPANNFGPLMALGVLAGNNVGGPNGIAVEKLALLKEAAIKACDAADGVTDRVISDPARCGFDPVQLQCKGETSSQCLTATEVAAAKRVYAGVRNAKGELVFPGTGFGSEPLWAAYASPGFRIGESFFQNVVANDPSWRGTGFDVDRDLARAEAAGVGDITAMDPDLTAFLSRGGKLLLYHGTTDGLIPFGNTENYYNSVVEKLGAERPAQHVRFFPVPGMDHCAGGEGAFAADWLGALERWDETGTAPDTLPAAHPMGEKPFSRPLCAYPKAAHYSGNGDASDAANWSCR